MKPSKIMTAIATTALMTGCASIVGEKNQMVTINSAPSNAAVVIKDENMQKVYSGTTPATLQLRKSDGSYFGGKTYTVELSKEGYETRTMMINSTPNGWYLAGNLVFGGLIGWLIVDPMTGAMYNLTPDKINASLGEGVAMNGDGHPDITLVLIEDVPMNMREEMEYIGKI
ncbi:PEGA domain-containing protein [Ectothiorhodospira mobilis]|uniref:PEGA domain-containing protein n=1 Tax=Ectothiorhodospira mobilis TaxID=195064 RepID=UPI0019053C1A|nr:PEGA domain-containing protein [Ectothiorhodospira mobilis]MBK1692099.1 hypothetical protein [Ectothiorhodospira mobilis]